ncbi:MAG: S-layer homology domain-containing protein [Oscillospiraceae bacterium]
MYDYVNNGDYIYIDPKGGTAKLGSTEITTAGRYKIESDVTLTEPTGALGWTYNGTIEPHTFVAVWPSTKTVTISYLDYYYGADTETIKYDGSIIVDPNGGSVVWGRTTISSKQTIENIRTDAALARATRNGYTFYGWVVSYTPAGTPVFTATWSKDYYYNTYSIYYYDYDDCKSEYANFPYGTSVVIDPNGGTAKLSGTSFSTKQSFNIYRDYTLTDASRSGYTFYGWDLTKSGSTYYFTAMWSRYKSDVPYMLNGTDHYAYIKGYPNGSFKPTDTITRAEAATIFYRLLTDSTRKAYATTYNSFKDVPATAWYNTAVSTMAKLGIVNGGADGYFRPNDPITRAEIAAMIARCDGAYYTGTSTVFSDTYGHWAAGYIDRAYELGWINGYGTTYAPDRYISRAETVAVLNRVLNRAPQYTSDLTRNYTTFSDVATSAWYYLDVEEAANSHTYTRKSNADYETWTKLIADPSWF